MNLTLEYIEKITGKKSNKSNVIVGPKITYNDVISNKTTPKSNVIIHPTVGGQKQGTAITLPPSSDPAINNLSNNTKQAFINPLDDKSLYLSELASLERKLTNEEKDFAQKAIDDYDENVPLGGYVRENENIETLRRKLHPVSTKVNDFLKGANPFSWMANAADYGGNLLVKQAQEAEEARKELESLEGKEKFDLSDPKTRELVLQSNRGIPFLNSWIAQFDPTSQSTASQSLNEQKVKGQQNFKENLSPAGQVAADVAFSGADMIGKYAASRITGVPFLALSAFDVGSQQGQKALNEGYSSTQSAALALGSGAINAGIESFGGIAGKWGGKLLNALGKSKAGSAILQKLPSKAIDYVTKAANSVGGKIANSAFSEGTEEFTEYGAQLFLENLVLDKETPVDVKQALYQAGVGAIAGGIFGGANAAASGISNAVDRVQSKLPNPAELDFDLAGDVDFVDKNYQADFYAGPMWVDPDIDMARKYPVEKVSDYLALPAATESTISGGKNVIGTKVDRTETLDTNADPFDDPIFSISSDARIKPYLDQLSQLKTKEELIQYRNGVDNQLKELDDFYNFALNAYSDYIYNYSPKGVDLVPIFDQQTGETVNRVRVSNNEPWYSKYAKKKLSKKDSMQLAEAVLNSSSMQKDFPDIVDPEIMSLINQTAELRDDLHYLKNNVLKDDLVSVSGNNGVYNLQFGEFAKPIAKGGEFVKPINAVLYNGTTKSNENLLENLLQNQDSIERNQMDAMSVPPVPGEALPTVNANTNFGKNTVGAAESGGKQTTEQLLEEFGAFPQGEQPRAREVQIPKETREGKTSRFARTAAESAAVNDNTVNEIQKEITEGTFAYQPISDQKALNRANERIEGRNLNELVNEFEGIFHSNKQITKYDIAFGERLIQAASAAGDYETATRLIADVAAAGTEAGQVVQALRILKRLTPEGKLLTLQRAVDRINSGKNRNQKKVVIPQENASDILSQTTTEGIDNATAKAIQAIADQMPATWADKWNAWRYMAMLTNPGTHIRNITGNLIFAPVRKFKNIIGAGLETAFNVQDRSKAILNRFSESDKALLDFAKQDYDEVYKQVNTGKRNPADMIRDQRRIFDTNWLENLRKGNLKALEFEDALFSKEAYADSLAQFMKANNLKPDDLKTKLGGESEIGAKAREYAIREAQKATYQDASAVANALNKFSKTNAATAILTEGILPFKKTPVNVLKRGFEYSPFGLVKNLIFNSYKLKNGDITSTDFIDSIASGLSGTGVMILGAFLTHMGLLVGGGSENKKEQSFNELQGEQTYSLKIGPYTYTIDWAAPSSIPLFIGSEIYNQKGNLSFSTLLDAMSKITDPMFEMSMLDGLNSTIKTAGYSANPVSDILTNTIANYFGQSAPTLTGRIARTSDPVRRTTYIDKNSSLPQLAQSFLQNVQGKIPDLIPGNDPLERFTSKGKQPYLDAWGREDVSDSFVGRIGENFFSPGYIAEDRSTAADDLLSKLYSESGDSSILPSKPQKYITIDKQRIDLTGDQYTEYTKTKGQLSNQLVSDLAENSTFNSLSNEDKSKVINEIYSYADAIGKSTVSDYKLDGWILDAQNAQDQGIPLDDFFVVRNYKNGLESIKDEKGKVIESTTDQFRDFLLQSDQFTPNEKSLLDELLIGSNTVPDYSNEENFLFSLLSDSKQEAYSDVERIGISKGEYAQYEDLLSDVESDKNAQGKTISGSLKRNRIDALIEAGMERQMAVRYVNARYY